MYYEAPLQQMQIVSQSRAASNTNITGNTNAHGRKKIKKTIQQR